MKKFLLATVGLVALGMAAPASAADLAARPYTKAPPPMIAPIYDWTGFYIGANGGWGQSRNCVDFVGVAGVVVADGCRERSGGLVGGQGLVGIHDFLGARGLVGTRGWDSLKPCAGSRRRFRR